MNDKAAFDDAWMYHVKYVDAIFSGKRLENGEYPHSLLCSGSRQHQAGTPGVTCSCRVVPKAALDPFKELVEAAYTFMTMQGHTPKCQFDACTCGAVQEREGARLEFFRLYRKWRKDYAS